MSIVLVKGVSQEDSTSPIETPGVPPRVEKAGCVVLMGRYIVLVRPNDPARDEWLLPKGHIEDGELPSACAIREALEETGVSVTLANDLPFITTERVTDASPTWPAEHEVIHWFLGRGTCLLTEKIEGTKAGVPRRVGVFPHLVALTKLHYLEHRKVLCSIIDGTSGLTE